VIAWEQAVEYSPEVLIIMPCGYKVSRSVAEVDQLASNPGWYNLPVLKEGHVYVVDSPAYFSRPGPQIVNGLEFLLKSFTPSCFPD